MVANRRLDLGVHDRDSSVTNIVSICSTHFTACKERRMQTSFTYVHTLEGYTLSSLPRLLHNPYHQLQA